MQLKSGNKSPNLGRVPLNKMQMKSFLIKRIVCFKKLSELYEGTDRHMLKRLNPQTQFLTPPYLID